MTDDEFLRAIAAAPADPLVKLAYADWLDDRGETDRAECLRLWQGGAGRQRPDHPAGRRFRELGERVGRRWAGRVAGRLAPAWGEETELALATLNGFLDAYTHLNAGTNEGYTFEALLLRLDPSPEAAVAATFAPSDSPAVVLHPLADWRADLRAVLVRWLFANLRVGTGGVEEVRTCDGIAGEVMIRIQDVIRPDGGSRVEVRPSGFYECVWDDLLLVQGDCGLFLHFGVSD
jgi:uncharacterized protein (TIGR02996 family)